MARLRLRLAVTDGAGNIGNFYTSTAPYITVDIAAPTAPSITSGPPNPLRGNPPTYIWASTDATGAGYFRYRYDTDAGYSTETTDLTASPSAKYGARYFYVQERDAAGNWSTSDSWYAWIYPDWIEPRYVQTVDRSPTVRWANCRSFRARSSMSSTKRARPAIWTQLFNDTTTLAIELPPVPSMRAVPITGITRLRCSALLASPTAVIISGSTQIPCPDAWITSACPRPRGLPGGFSLPPRLYFQDIMVWFSHGEL